MKITGSGPTAGPRERRRIAGRGETSDSSFAEQVGARPLASSGLVPTMPLAGLDGVLVVQEAADSTAERRRATRHGHGVLDELQALQIGMVEGWVSETGLRRLAGLLDRLRPAALDPELEAVLDEIELRAAVELAKLARKPG
jgi:hypothetical protein